MFISSAKLQLMPARAPRAGRPASGLDRPEAKSDHRMRVADQKWERMRERLTNATRPTRLTCEASRSPAVGDVIRLSGVSRRDSCKHLDTIDEVFTAIGRRMVQQVRASHGRLARPLTTSAARVTMGLLMAPAGAAMEPESRRFHRTRRLRRLARQRCATHPSRGAEGMRRMSARRSAVQRLQRGDRRAHWRQRQRCAYLAQTPARLGAHPRTCGDGASVWESPRLKYAAVALRSLVGVDAKQPWWQPPPAV